MWTGIKLKVLHYLGFDFLGHSVPQKELWMDKRSLCWKSTNLLDFIYRIWRRKPCPRIPGDQCFGLLQFCIFTFWSLCQPQWWGTFSRSRCACLRWILMSISWCGRVPNTTLQKLLNILRSEDKGADIPLLFQPILAFLALSPRHL